MNTPLKQHLIDPEICIRCYTCEMTCPIEAITHDDNNVVVDAEKCNFCMDCIPVCPTGSIDEWRVVETPYSLDEQFGWEELPEQADLAEDGGAGTDRSKRSTRPIAAPARRGPRGRRRQGEGARLRLEAQRQPVHPRASPRRRRCRATYRLTDRRLRQRCAPHHPRFRRHAVPGARRPVGRHHPAGRRTRRASRICRGSTRCPVPARRRAAELQQPLAHREARAGRALLELSSAI